MVYQYVTFLLAFMISSGGTTAQETDYLDAQLNLTEKDKAVFVRQLNLVNESYYAAHIYDKAGNLRVEGFYIEGDYGLQEHGRFTYYHSNGKIESTGIYEHGIKVGFWERYAVSGTRRPDRYYSPESVELLRTVDTR